MGLFNSKGEKDTKKDVTFEDDEERDDEEIEDDEELTYCVSLNLEEETEFEIKSLEGLNFEQAKQKLKEILVKIQEKKIEVITFDKEKTGFIWDWSKVVNAYIEEE